VPTADIGRNSRTCATDLAAVIQLDTVIARNKDTHVET
jgi:hypothetical protein